MDRHIFDDIIIIVIIIMIAIMIVIMMVMMVHDDADNIEDDDDWWWWYNDNDDDGITWWCQIVTQKRLHSIAYLVQYSNALGTNCWNCSIESRLLTGGQATICDTANIGNHKNWLFCEGFIGALD